MKTLRTIALLTVLASMLFAAGAQAATIGVYFGQNRMPWKTAAPNQSFDIWIIVKNVDSTIDAVDYKLTLPTQVIVTDPGFSDTGLHIGNASTGYAVGLGACIPSFNDHEIVIQHMTAYAFTLFPQFDVTITAFEGSTQETPTAPRFSNCAGGFFDLDVENGIIIGTTTAGDSESFGAIKALY